MKNSILTTVTFLTLTGISLFAAGCKKCQTCTKSEYCYVVGTTESCFLNEQAANQAYSNATLGNDPNGNVYVKKSGAVEVCDDNNKAAELALQGFNCN